MIVNYDGKTFMVQATGVNAIKLFQLVIDAQGKDDSLVQVFSGKPNIWA